MAIAKKLADEPTLVLGLIRELYSRIAENSYEQKLQLERQYRRRAGRTRDEAFNYARWCRQADGPDQVHQMALGKQVINRYSP